MSKGRKRTTSFDKLATRWSRKLPRIFRRNKLPFRALGYTRAAQVFVCRLYLEDTTLLDQVLSLSEQIGLGLGVDHVRMARHRGVIDVEVELPQFYHRAIPARGLPQKKGSWVCLGQTTLGQNVQLNLAGNRTSHGLISGMTGSGKTYTEKLIVWSLVKNNDPEDIRLILIDCKGGQAWKDLTSIPHLVFPTIKSAEGGIRALAWVVGELNQRMEHGYSNPQVFVVIDEVRELLLVSDTAGIAIQRITSLGRELGIHLIMATQYPSNDVVGGAITKANLQYRLTGLVRSANEAWISTGLKKSGAEGLLGNGDFIFNAIGLPIRLQVGLIKTRDLWSLNQPIEETNPINLAEVDLSVLTESSSIAPPKFDLLDADEAILGGFAKLLATDSSLNLIKDEIRQRGGKIGTARARQLKAFARRLREAMARDDYIVTKIGGRKNGQSTKATAQL